MNAKHISTNRASIMGLSMLMIIIFHTDIRYPHVLDLIKNFGDFGVNLFFAVSGFSMCYSWAKDPKASVFLKNRFLRIGITLLPISIIWNLLSYLSHETPLIEAICKILTIQFWIDGNLLQWFISGILVFYLITPLWMKVYDKNRLICLIITLIVCIWCTIAPLYGVLWYIKCFIQRVPAYFIGLYLGKHVIEGKQDSKFMNYTVWILLLIGFIGFALIGFNTLNYFWKYILYTVLTYPSLMLISYLFEKTKNIQKPFVLPFLGSITLEIYLLQEKILKVLHLLINKVGIKLDNRNIILNIIVITFSVLLGYFYHSITNNIYKKIRNQ